MSGHATVIAGFGGQGLLFAGHVLAQAANREGKEVSWLPSYGPEMRGGTASCTVIVSDRPIGSPIVDTADSVIALNPPSMARFDGLLVPGGLLVVNTTLIEAQPRRTDLEVVALACTALARSAGDDRLASVVALGALIARRSIVSAASVVDALADLVGARQPALLAADLAAFDAGYRAATGVTVRRSAMWPAQASTAARGR